MLGSAAPTNLSSYHPVHASWIDSQNLPTLSLGFSSAQCRCLRGPTRIAFCLLSEPSNQLHILNQLGTLTPVCHNSSVTEFLISYLITCSVSAFELALAFSKVSLNPVATLTLFLGIL
jgi:hypothetical protein